MHPSTPASVILGLATLLAATPALAAANLRVTLPAPPPTLVYDDIDLGVVVANDGNKSAAAVVLTIDLPKTHTSPQTYIMGLLDSFDPRCTRAGARLTCNLGTVAKGQSTLVGVRIALPWAAETLTIAASATTSSPENTATDNAASVAPALLYHAAAIADGDLAVNRHCTGQGLTAFYECTLFPSSISAHDTIFHADGTITFPDEPGYGGSWTQTAPDHLSFVYTAGDEVIAEFAGRGVDPACFEGLVTFPDSAYVAPYEVCI